MANKNAKPPENTKFKPGKSGNAKGRPPVLPDLKAAIAKVFAEEKDGLQALDAVLMNLRAKAMKGDTKAAEILLDRGYGRAPQAIDVTTKGESLNKADWMEISFDDMKPKE